MGELTLSVVVVFFLAGGGVCGKSLFCTPWLLPHIIVYICSSPYITIISVIIFITYSEYIFFVSVNQASTYFVPYLMELALLVTCPASL